PMAGRGTRLRPHTLTTPKPLIPIAGKPIVQRLVEDIAEVCNQEINNIGFIIGRDFGVEVEKDLKEVAESVGGKGHIYYQDEKLGTAHAILCAQEILEGNSIVAFADTLFRADFKLNPEKDGIIWVQKVEDPSAFGVVKIDNDNHITDFIEKPKDFVSDLAIIGIYYFKDGEFLKNELQYLVDNKIMGKGEYQLTDALENMKQKGAKFVPGEVSEWLDCGNKDATVHTNQRYLEYIKDQGLIAKSVKQTNCVIIPPVYIGEDATVENCVLGPHVSVGKNTSLKNSVIQNSIIQENSEINNANFKNSMLGNFVTFEGNQEDLSLGDYNAIKRGNN
ncbi:sugar phosphate nucleotidyltransferase, partial [Fulvivirga aurantia]|uniref:sugar phosphate nucleotidyltransferase n=1 Tax=Fulvivirga aurantia TaxID=2529383 RepID=UPI001FE2E69F